MTIKTMRRRDLLRTAVAAPFALAAPPGLCPPPPYQPTWDSLDRRPTPAWFTDAKFGIFIHWGVYSVPGYAAAGSKAAVRRMVLELDHHKAATPCHGTAPGPSTSDLRRRLPYQNFAPMFRAELFDPDHWADVFQRSGAKYVVLTSKHHEGFALWPSAEASRTWGRPWNAVEIGPRRDLAGRSHQRRPPQACAWASTIRSMSGTTRCGFPTSEIHRRAYASAVQGRRQPLQALHHLLRWRMGPAFRRMAQPELLAWLFNESPVQDEVVIDDRWGKDTRHKHGGYYTTEYTAGMSGMDHPWEESRGMGFSYGYNRAETLEHYRTGRELVLMLVDLVSRGGNLLLDIGPTADGRIPVIMEERLTQIGEWLKINGEAIYGTHARKTPRQWSEGEDSQGRVQQGIHDAL